MTGATTSELGLDLAASPRFAVAFLGSAALWWLYFNFSRAIAERRLELAADRTSWRATRYTYLHVVLVAGDDRRRRRRRARDRPPDLGAARGEVSSSSPGRRSTSSPTCSSACVMAGSSAGSGAGAAACVPVGPRGRPCPRSSWRRWSWRCSSPSSGRGARRPAAGRPRGAEPLEALEAQAADG